MSFEQLARNIKTKFDRQNKTRYSQYASIKSNGTDVINHNNLSINYNKIPTGKLANWDYVMFEHWHWPCMNDWEYHAIVLLNYLITCAELVRVKPLTKNEMSIPFERYRMDLNTWNRRVGATLPQLINSQGGRHLWGKGDPAGMTALHYATQQDFPDVVDKLLSIPGICVNVRDFSGRTPLHLTFINRNSDRIITSLIKHGADFTIQDNTGGTPFLNAMLFLRDDWLVHMIFDHLVNYDIHQQDDKGFDLLRWAVECNCPLLVRKIMTRGGQPNNIDKKGRNTIKASKLSYNEEIQKIFD